MFHLLRFSDKYGTFFDTANVDWNRETETVSSRAFLVIQIEGLNQVLSHPFFFTGHSCQCERRGERSISSRQCNHFCGCKHVPSSCTYTYNQACTYSRWDTTIANIQSQRSRIQVLHNNPTRICVNPPLIFSFTKAFHKKWNDSTQIHTQTHKNKSQTQISRDHKRWKNSSIMVDLRNLRHCKLSE